MRAIVQDVYGPARQVLRVAEIDRPEPGPGQVLLRVQAAGVGRETVHLVEGAPYVARLALGLRRPKARVPGRDVAGRVEALGPGVEGFAVGDEVFGVAAGPFAEYAVADAERLVARPAAWTAAEAGAVAVSGCTAVAALHDRVVAGQRVLVIGAGGGVGSFAVQVAKDAGAHVTGVCSTGKVDLVISLGADEVIDHTKGDLSGHAPWDLVVDTGGGRSLRTLRRVMSPRGTLVIVGAEGGERWRTGLGRVARAVLVSPFLRQRLTGLVSAETRPRLEQLAALGEKGALRVAVERTFTLDETPEAVDHVAAGQARGKVVVVP